MLRRTKLLVNQSDDIELRITVCRPQKKVFLGMIAQSILINRRSANVFAQKMSVPPRTLSICTLCAVLSIFVWGILDTQPAWAAKPVRQSIGYAEVDWTHGAILATGTGAPRIDLSNVAKSRLSAEKTAIMDARTHMLAAIRKMRVTAAQSGRQLLADASIRIKVEGVIEDCAINDTRYYSNGGVDVVLRCSFGRGLASVLGPTGPKTPIRASRESEFTGLIVDASGINAVPAMFLTLVGDNGKVLLEPKMVTAEALRAGATARYVRSVANARALPQAGENPIVVNVARVNRRRGWVLAAADVNKLSGIDLTFLARGQVVVVLGPEGDLQSVR